LRDDVENFGNFQFTATPADGFYVGKMVQGGNDHTQIGNHNYSVVPLTVVLTANKTGTLTVGPFTAGAVIVVASADQPQDPFFRQFGIR
jgi:hypothetical protein